MDELILRKAAKWIWTKRKFSNYWNHPVLTRDNPDPTSPLIDKRIAFQVFAILEERKLMLPVTVTKGNDIFSAYRINFDKEKEWKYLISKKKVFDMIFIRTIKTLFVKHGKLLAICLLFPLIVAAIAVFVFQPLQKKIQENAKEGAAKITTKGASGKDNSGVKTVIDIANITMQSEMMALKERYKDRLDILYEDMSRKGQLNGTPMLGRLSKLCLNEIEDCALLIHNTLRVVRNSGISYSDKLSAELKNVVRSHLTGEIGSINGYIRQKSKFYPTLANQLSIKETELNNKRSNELKKINSEIDLIVISLRNKENEVVENGVK